MKFLCHSSLLLAAMLLINCFSEQTSDSTFDAGVQKVSQYRFQDANKLFSDMLEDDPQSAEALAGVGLAYEAQLYPISALAHYATAAEVDPGFPFAFAGIYRIYMMLDEFDLAADAAARCVKLNPHDSLAHVMLASAHLAREAGGQARKVVDDAGEYLPATWAAILKAHSFVIDRQKDSTEFWLQQAMTGENMSKNFYHMAADCFETRSYLDSALALSKLAVAASHNMALDGNRHFLRALRLEYMHETQKAITSVPDNDQATLLKAVMETRYWFATGNRSRLLHAGNNILLVDPTGIDAQLYFMKAELLASIRVGLPMERSNFNRLITEKNWPDETENIIKYYVARSLYGSLLEQETRDDFMQIRGMLSNRPEVKIPILVKTFEIGLEEEFHSKIKAMIAGHQTQPDWLTQIARALSTRRLHQNERAEKLCRQALELDPEYYRAFEELVDLFFRTFQSKKALQAFEQFTDYRTFSHNTRKLYWKALILNGNYALALAHFTENIGPASGNVATFIYFSDLLNERSRKAEIKEVVTLLINSNDNSSEILATVARLNLDIDNSESALEQADRALDLESDNYEAKVAYARALYATGDVDASLEQFATNKVERNMSIENNFYYSRALAENSGEILKASNIAREALYSASYENLRVWMNVCYTYLKVGRYDLCRAESGKAAKRFTDSPIPRFYLGMALYHEGKSAAKATLREAIDMGLTGVDKKQAQATLKKL